MVYLCLLRSKKKLFNNKSYSAYISNEIKKEYQDSPFLTTPIEGLVRESLQMYSKEFSDMLKGKAVIPRFRKGQPIPIRERNFDILDKNTIRLRLINKLGGEKYNINKVGISYPLDFVVASKKGHAYSVINKILSGEYLPGDSHIQKDGKDIYFLLTFKETEFKQVAISKDVILGVDLGIVNAVTLAVSNSKKHAYINGGEIDAFRKRIEKQRNSKRNQLKVCSDNRKGHGRKQLLSPLENLSNKISKFKDNKNHQYSKFIVNYAIKNGCGIIQMEDLSGIRKSNKRLATWSYYDLQQKVIYKALEYGIEVRLVKPQYTSLRCNKCGCIDLDNRPTQQDFKCTTCGHTDNADLNASRNLSIAFIDDIIKDTIQSDKELKKKIKTLKNKSDENVDDDIIRIQIKESVDV